MKFFKRNKEMNVLSFTNGTVIPLQKVRDEMFAAGLMGQGIAIDSTDGKFYSPVNGKITMIFPTKHALGIKMENGIEILLHIGLDTVNLKGEGFIAYVQDGQEVHQGDLLLEADLHLIKEKGYFTEAILCFTEPKELNISFTLENTVKANEDTIAVIRQ